MHPSSASAEQSSRYRLTSSGWLFIVSFTTPGLGNDRSCLLDGKHIAGADLIDRIVSAISPDFDVWVALALFYKLNNALFRPTIFSLNSIHLFG